MTILRLSKLATRFLISDFRKGELTILIAALIIAVACTSSIGVLSDRLKRTMTNQSSEFMGADMVVRGHEVFSLSWLEKANQLGLSHGRTVEFASVIIANDELLLTSVKAVSANYPLRGRLKISDGGIVEEKFAEGIPRSGFVWVDPRVLTHLKLNLGDSVEIGEKQLTIEHVLTYEPDRGGNIYSLSPRVLISEQDLEATGIVQPGSHLHYREMFNGTEKQRLKYSHWLKPQLTLAQHLVDINEDRPELGSALRRGEQYLGLTSIAVIIIAGVAIAMAARRFSKRHYDTTAILRCLGLKQNEILGLFGMQLLLVGLISGLIGVGLGWVLHLGLFHLLESLLPENLANPSLTLLLLGAATGLAVLIGFSLPAILQLKSVSPLRVLRRELAPLPPSAWLVYISTAVTLFALITYHTKDLESTLIIGLVGLVSIALLSLMGATMLKFILRMLPHSNFAGRLAAQNMERNPKASNSQILAFGVTLMAMVLCSIVRTDLVETWAKQLPEDIPNYFAFNIYAHELDGLQKALATNNIKTSHFYPIARGRLTEINGTGIREVSKKNRQTERAAGWLYSLTETPSLPEGNRILHGRWWNNSPPGVVSIEQRTAERLGVILGDQLKFTVGSQQLSVTITSIRSVRWDSLQANFFLILSPGTLDQFPTTYLTNFYLPDHRKAELNAVSKVFPTVTLLEIDIVIEKVKTILKQVTAAVEYILIFALAAGVVVLFAAVRASLDERIHHGVLLRTLGANRKLLRQSHLIEFFGLGFIAGLLAAAASEILVYWLYVRILQLPYDFKWQFWIATPLIGAILVGLAGLWTTRNISKKSPMTLLREL
ncbi:MAG: FtsX-like permease family protein [Methylococcales bacterium]